MSVRSCPNKYDHNLEGNTYNEIFNSYSYELDHFQKFAIQAIEEGKHILVTASTGSGKSLPAEYAINKFCREGKKVIYTSPIKSLSNQKFHEFSQKYQDVSFGILTGDIKFNPQASCLIMTTEILRNTLFRTPNNENPDDSIFTINVETELACVVFDEIHYINDRDRGKVWEETIIKMPSNVLMVMLSATIDRPEKFAKWIIDTKNHTNINTHTNGERDIWIASTEKRVVPLSHYSYFKIPDSLLKKAINNVKCNSSIETLLSTLNGNLITLRSADGKFYNESVTNLKKITSYLHQFGTNFEVKYKYVLNQIINYLSLNNMLPAICFVFSRKNVTEYASCIEFSLIDLHKQTAIEKECRNILTKLPNYKEYLDLPEYQQMINYLKKGVAVHHSGILPVLREMVELLFAKGYIKLLFATETFAVGVNMPTKTVIFSSLSKFDGNGFRSLHSHEYTQMAGRAGRRGLDTVGHVIHLNNMFDLPTLFEYESILNGKPQVLNSKFEIDFNLVLRLLGELETKNRSNSLVSMKRFIEKSMINDDIQKEYDIIENEIIQLENELSNFGFDWTTRIELFQQYQHLKTALDLARNNQKKKIQNDIAMLSTKYQNEHVKEDDSNVEKSQTHEIAQQTLENDYKLYLDSLDKEKRIDDKKQQLHNISTYIEHNLNEINQALYEYEFIDYLNDESTNLIVLTKKGRLASKMQEVNCLMMSEILMNGTLNDLTVSELVAVLSCFVDIGLQEDKRITNPQNCSSSEKVCSVLTIMNNTLAMYCNLQEDLNLAIDKNLCFDVQDHMMDWCYVSSEEECKNFMDGIYEHEIFLGEFIKAILKINNVVNELKNACEVIENIELKQKLSQIPSMTLKFVATNQSLYI